eukprot:m.118359 g.118359  ORF g.118359 m.118359 type:complete len:365 (+) comp12892_c2_seq2:37-1131(+)
MLLTLVGLAAAAVIVVGVVDVVDVGAMEPTNISNGDSNNKTGSNAGNGKRSGETPSLRGPKSQQQSLQNQNFRLNGESVLVTGGCGFIGFNLALKLHRYNKVVVLDIFSNTLGDMFLKEIRAHKLHLRGVTVVKGDMCDRSLLQTLFKTHNFTLVMNLAAQAGVRLSMEQPHDYIENNVNCFVTLLEELKGRPHIKLGFASSSSVYGSEAKIPFTESLCSDTPSSIYGATKRMDEMVAHVYNTLYGIRSVGFRFFTVYGPWGRVDMAPFKFAEKILAGEPINVHYTKTGEDMKRDFTYVDDIVNGIERGLFYAKGFDIFNLGYGHPGECHYYLQPRHTLPCCYSCSRWYLFNICTHTHRLSFSY